jgi:hypothetical protein
MAGPTSAMPPGPNTVRTWLPHRRYAVPPALLDHDPEQVARETAPAAPGGPIDGCADVLLRWRTGTGQGP